MELNDFIGLLKRKKQTIVSLMAIFMLVGIILVAVQPFKYSSGLKLLVFQSSNQVVSDPYAIARSNEYLSGVLAKITQSNSFYDRVANSGFEIDQDYFGETPKKQNTRWIKTVDAKVMNDTGIISISTYHTDRQQAEQIARAVGHVLMTQHTNYHGLSNDLKIKLLDEPITSKYPVRPNIALSLILSLVLGFIFSLSYIYLLPNVRHDVCLFTRKRRKIEARDVEEAKQIEKAIDQKRSIVNNQVTMINSQSADSLIDSKPEQAESFGKFDDWFNPESDNQTVEDNKFDPFK